MTDPTIKDLTSYALRTKVRSYDQINNEGGEGYNPYRAELERRDSAIKAEYANTPRGGTIRPAFAPILRETLDEAKS